MSVFFIKHFCFILSIYLTPLCLFFPQKCWADLFFIVSRIDFFYNKQKNMVPHRDQPTTCFFMLFSFWCRCFVQEFYWKMLFLVWIIKSINNRFYEKCGKNLHFEYNFLTTSIGYFLGMSWYKYLKSLFWKYQHKHKSLLIITFRNSIVTNYQFIVHRTDNHYTCFYQTIQTLLFLLYLSIGQSLPYYFNFFLRT